MNAGPAIYQPQEGDGLLCQGCTRCCRWPGQVLFKPEMMPQVAAHLGMDEYECTEMFFELHDDRKHLRTKPTTHGGCIFVDENGCRVYPVRPRQCRAFPYMWRREEEDLMSQCKLYCAIRMREWPKTQ